MSQLDPVQLQLEALNQRLNCFEKTLREKFASRDKANEVAAAAVDKRFYAANEFRQLITDQSATFVRSVTYDTAHTALVEKVEIVTKQVVAMDTTLRSKIGSIANGPTFLIGVCSVATVLIIAVVGSAIQLGSVQTHVAINTTALEQITERERHNNNVNAAQQADINVIRTIQQGGVARIERLEEYFLKRPWVDMKPLVDR